jgi:hypothetical protein
VIKQDTGDGTTIKFYCPPGCASVTGQLKTGNVYGTDVYEDRSNVCLAAIHAGAIELDPDYGFFNGAMVRTVTATYPTQPTTLLLLTTLLP